MHEEFFIYTLAIVIAVLALVIAIGGIVWYIGMRHYPLVKESWQKMPDGQVKRVIRP